MYVCMYTKGANQRHVVLYMGTELFAMMCMYCTVLNPARTPYIHTVPLLCLDVNSSIQIMSKVTDIFTDFVYTPYRHT